MNSMELKSTSATSVVRNKYKLDTIIQFALFEWRGTLNEGDLSLIIKYNLGAWKVKYAETDYDLNNVNFIYVAQEQRPMRYLIYDKNEIKQGSQIYPLGTDLDTSRKTLFLCYEDEVHFTLVGYFNGSHMQTVFDNNKIPEELYEVYKRDCKII